MRCTVLGGGSWGTALAAQLARKPEHDVVLWDRNPDRCDAINEQHRNPRYLREVDLPEALRAEPDLATALEGARLVVPVIPSHALRQVLTDARPNIGPQTMVCCATKGIEGDTLATMHDVCVEVLGHPERISMLYGPSFAIEVATMRPTAVVIAGPHDATHAAAEAFHSDTFRAYHTEDVVGVCIGGSLKNVLAIACGVSDGLGLGANARAALITRGLAEIARLALKMNADPLTMMGLAGIGDLVLTCTGNASRNRRVGLALGQGRTKEDILEELGEVAEGVHTAESAYALARREGVDMPITERVRALLCDEVTAADALASLMQRERRAERDHG